MKTTLLFLIGLFIFTSIAQAAPVKAIVRSKSGWAEYKPAGSGVFKALRPGMKLEMGSTVRTSKDGIVVLLVTPGSAMRVAPDTELVLNEMAFAKKGSKVTQRKARIKLSSGTISALLDHRDPDVTDFKIETPQGSAAARGTFYGVSVVNNKTYISVKDGKVGVLPTAK